MGLFALLAAAISGAATAKPASMVFLPGHIDLDRGPDGNTVILDAPQGLIVVDSGRHPEHAQSIIDHARKVGKPVAAVVNTHWHLDHATGNRDLLAAYPAAHVIGSRAVEGALDGFLARSRAEAEKALASGKLPDGERAALTRALAIVSDRKALVPGRPVERDGAERLAGRRIELRLAPNAATEGDLWLLVPDEKLAIVGDLVVGPVPFFDTGCEEGWRQALAAIAAAKWDRLVPGHGAIMSRPAFQRWRGAFERYLDCARSTRPAQDCASEWTANAAGFFSASEANDVPPMARYYVEQVLRAAPEERMAYCRVKN